MKGFLHDDIPPYGIIYLISLIMHSSLQALQVS